MKQFIFCLFLLSMAIPSRVSACNPPVGLNAAPSGTTAVLDWAAQPNALSYDIEIEDALNNPSLFHVEATASGSTYTVTGLTVGQHYKFKLRANCQGDHSDWSDWFFFTAGSGSGGGNGGGACGIPTGLSTTIANGTTTLNWTAVSGASSYMIEVEDGSDNSVPFNQVATVTGTTFVPTGLTVNKNYKFKVRAVCSGNQSDWSDWESFTTSLVSQTHSAGFDGSGNDDVQKTVIVAPNPIKSNVFQVQLTGFDGQKTLIRLVDAMGVTIVQQEVISEADFWSQTCYLPIGVPSGLYYVHVSNAQQQFVSKVLIAE